MKQFQNRVNGDGSTKRFHPTGYLVNSCKIFLGVVLAHCLAAWAEQGNEAPRLASSVLGQRPVASLSCLRQITLSIVFSEHPNEYLQRCTALQRGRVHGVGGLFIASKSSRTKAAISRGIGYWATHSPPIQRTYVEVSAGKMDACELPHYFSTSRTST